MPRKGHEQRRAYDRAYKQAWRARRKAALARQGEEDRQHCEWLEARRLDNLVPMVLNHDLHLDDGRTGYTFPRGSTLWFLPGLTHVVQRALLAEPVEREVVTSVRVITRAP